MRLVGVDFITETTCDGFVNAEHFFVEFVCTETKVYSTITCYKITTHHSVVA